MQRFRLQTQVHDNSHKTNAPARFTAVVNIEEKFKRKNKGRAPSKFYYGVVGTGQGFDDSEELAIAKAFEAAGQNMVYNYKPAKPQETENVG